MVSERDHRVTPGARARQKAETHEKLLRAARRLFERHGFENATMRMLASETGIATGTVFVHFKDKHALLAATLHEGVDGALAKAASSRPARGARARPREELLALTEPLFRHYAQNPALSRVLVKEGLFMAGDAGTAFDAQLEGFQRSVEAIYAEGVRRGTLAAGLDCRLAATAFLSFYLLTLVAGLRGTAPTVDAQLAMLGGLVAQQLAGFSALAAPRKPRARKRPTTDESPTARKKRSL